MNTSTKSILFNSITRDNDKRGSIISIVDDLVQNVSIISCFAGSIRSNHYHNEDFHYMYVLEGEIDYFYKELTNDNINYYKIKKNDIIFTPNKEIHATFFPVDTKLIVSSKLPRDQATYENDTVRVELINQNNLQMMLNSYA